MAAELGSLRHRKRSASVASSNGGSIAFEALEKDRVRWQLYDSLCSQSEESHLTSGAVLSLFQENGILDTDPRIASIVAKLKKCGGYRKDIELGPEEFFDIIHGATSLLTKILKGSLVIPDFPDLCNDVDEIYNEMRHLKGGELADYIPQLAQQDPSLCGVAVCSVDGQRYAAGCKDYKFCVQSCCKPIAYLIAAEENGFDVIHHHIGREPSGAKFNQLTLKDFPSPENPSRKIPHNPMINAGAIMSCSLIKSNEPMSDRFQHVMEIWERLCASHVGFVNSVYLSEKDTADRNWCLGYMMQEYDSFPKGINLRDTLEFYFQQCSIEADIQQMSVLAGTIANGGTNPITGDRVFNPFHVRNCLSLMLSSGMYDYSGEWMFTVGLPAKSGVAGCIWCVVPNKLGVVTFSPGLDENGNSFRGVEAYKKLVDRFSFHQFDSLTGLVGDKTKKDPTKKTNQIMYDQVASLLFASSQGDLMDVINLYNLDVDIWAADYDNRTALHLSASEGHLNVVKFLIQIAKNVADGPEEVADKLSHRDRWGRTPLDDAISAENDKVISALMKVQARRGAGSEHETVFSNVNKSHTLSTTLTKRIKSNEESDSEDYEITPKKAQVSSPTAPVRFAGDELLSGDSARGIRFQEDKANVTVTKPMKKTPSNKTSIRLPANSAQMRY